jgi:general secretion pathway protein A
MYESYFGFTGAPFSLNPDPSFFFGSKGHSNALSYLKFGIYQGEGFVVVTGDIGAGKTTLVRTLLSELDQDTIVAAQIVSTQLEAGDLLRSVALAFGIAPKNLSKAELIATIEAFLTLLVTQRKRALLIVDEAQNLHREAVEELRMLSNFQLGNQALLQSFLVGQPELRVLLTSKPMEQFRQRVIASCHLGPMDKAETRGYIEHRLHQVGWNDNPVFEPEAFDRIFHWSSGIPRRVNLLCNRVLLSTYLSARRGIDGASVDAIGVEIRTEVGDATLNVMLAPATPGSQTAVADMRAPHAFPQSDARTYAAPRMPERLVIREHQIAGPLMCVAAGPLEEVRFAPLMQALKGHGTIPECVLVRLGDIGRFSLNDSFFSALGLDPPVIALEIAEANAASLMAEVIRRFAQTLENHRPSAVVVIGASDSALACSLVASKKGRPLFHIEAGVRAAAPSNDELNASLIDRVAQAFYAASMADYLNLIREGVSEKQLQHAGSLLVDAVAAAASISKPVHELVLRDLQGQRPRRLAGIYGMVRLDDWVRRGDAESIAELLSSLQEISREALLVWPLSRAEVARLDMLNLRSITSHERIACVEPVTYLEEVALLRGASFVVTDGADVQTQAAILQVRCLPVGEAARGRSQEASGHAAASHAAQQIASHMARWLASEPPVAR